MLFQQYMELVCTQIAIYGSVAQGQLRLQILSHKINIKVNSYGLGSESLQKSSHLPVCGPLSNEYF